MTGVVYYSRSFSSLREAAFEWLDEKTDQTPESAWFVETNDYQRQAINDAWRQEHSDFRLTVSGLTGLGMELHEQLFGPYPGIETLERRRMIEQALLVLDTATIAEPRQHTESISELFREIEAAGVTSIPELEAMLSNSDCRPDQQSVVKQAYQTYHDIRETLAHPQALSNSQKLQAVVNTDQSLTDALPHLDAIVISGLTDLSAIEQAFVERLSTEFPVVVCLPTPTETEPTAGTGAALKDTLEILTSELGMDPTWIPSEQPLPLASVTERLYRPTVDVVSTDRLTWHKAPTPEREVRHFARQIRDTLATDPDRGPDDIVVLAPGLLSYRDSLVDVFDAYDIEHTYRVSVLLERTYAGRAVLDAISLCESPRGDRIAQLATNPLVTLPDIDPAELADRQRRLYTPDPERLMRELDASREGVATLLEHLDAVQTATAAEVVPAFERLLEYIDLEANLEALGENATSDIGYEQRAHKRVEEILSSVQTVCETVSPETPLKQLAAALEGVRVTPPSQASDGVVEIIGLEDIPMAEFTDLYVLGATRDNLPRRQTRPRYFQQIGEQLDLYEQNKQRDIDRYRFGMAVTNASRVHITTPETTADDERQLPSPFIDELTAVTDLKPTEGVNTEQRGTREDLQRALAGSDPETVATALSHASDDVADQAFTTAARRSVRCGANRGSDELTKHDGQLSATEMDALHEKLDKTPVSHSRLTDYAKCGFRYLLTNGWELEEPEDIDPGISSLDIGLLIHKTAEKFFIRIQNDDKSPVDLSTHNREELEKELLQAGFDELSAIEDSSDDVFTLTTLAKIFAGLATPEENEYYHPPQQTVTDATEGILVQFLKKERSRAAAGHRPLYFEEPFGWEAGIEAPDGKSLPIKGIIDRIDRTADGTVTVFDYKFSRQSSVRRRENQARDGVNFQLPMYLLGARSILENNSDLQPHDIDARYYILSAAPELKIRNSLNSRFDDLDFERFLSETVPARISQALHGVEGGAFQPAIVGESMAPCSYCEFRDICDVRHHRRYDTIEHIDKTDHPAYVPRGARPADADTQLAGGDADE